MTEKIAIICMVTAFVMLGFGVFAFMKAASTKQIPGARTLYLLTVGMWVRRSLISFLISIVAGIFWWVLS